MAKIPFKVSARAARLIGRENISTSQGAVTELVKNSYDADAPVCLILFLPRFKEIPTKISNKQYIELSRLLENAESFYPQNTDETDVGSEPHSGQTRNISSSLDTKQVVQLKTAFQNILDLWIIDNGNGMTSKTIEDHWMVIGTDNKEVIDTSVGGRVVTGAKGIGRFSLDRLGQECELYSADIKTQSLAHWLVDWGDFEGDGKILDEVEAVLETEDGSIFHVYEDNHIAPLLPEKAPSQDGSGDKLYFDQGTAIKISFLHDNWDLRDSLKLQNTLEALLPPRERGDFNIYVYDHRDIESSGWLDNFPPEQFDYRLIAEVLEDGDVKIRLDRQEIAPSMISPTFFDFDEMKKEGFTQENFNKGRRDYTLTLSELFSLDKKKDSDQALNILEDLKAIGPFEFTLYFFKLANPSSDNLKIYPQKKFDVNKRRQWLKNSGGVRLYRDGFRVRPYGEPNTQGSDWLLLGQRVAANPAPASRIGWRVPPQQLAGTINITKARNPLLADQSNREGIMNERAFSTFRKIILELIRQFENDRSYIFYHFSKAYDIDNKEDKDIEDGKRLADEIIDGNKDDTSSETEDSSSNSSNEDSEKLAKALKYEQKKNEVLKDEMQVLRGMATLGTVLVSFTHELKQIQANMDVRQARLEKSLKAVIDEVKLESVPPLASPFSIIDRWRREDKKVSRWVDFALTAVSPKKRRRRIINLVDYLGSLSTHWTDFLEAKNVHVKIGFETENEINVLAHEIDLDSVFYNLIVNSVEAFIQPSDSKDREILIQASASENDGKVIISYQDNGPGLSSNLLNENDIFIYGVSSKGNSDQSGINGTGIGMWLVQTIVDDYNGSLNLDCKIGEEGFSILIDLPLYVKDA